MHNTQIHHWTLNFIRTCIILYFATLSAMCDLIFLILISENPIFTVRNGYLYVIDYCCKLSFRRSTQCTQGIIQKKYGCIGFWKSQK